MEETIRYLLTLLVGLGFGSWVGYLLESSIWIWPSIFFAHCYYGYYLRIRVNEVKQNEQSDSR
jgi:hypothetical protein